jgi:2-iminobutanoate/2-iminopropanoate deaminase
MRSSTGSPPRCDAGSAAALGATLALALVLGACVFDRAPGRAPARATLRTERAPAPIGPYSQAVRAGDTLWLAGQIGSDPRTGELAGGGIEAQTRQALANVAAVLEAAGGSLGDVVQTQVFLTDLAEFASFNAVYAESFPSAPPARATVQVSALPRGARVEIVCTAVLRSPHGER